MKRAPRRDAASKTAKTGTAKRAAGIRVTRRKRGIRSAGGQNVHVPQAASSHGFGLQADHERLLSEADVIGQMTEARSAPPLRRHDREGDCHRSDNRARRRFRHGERGGRRGREGAEAGPPIG
jgi:hypothetical protein